jgi:hypothetical protein
LLNWEKKLSQKLGELAVESTIKHFKYLTQYKKITTNLEEEIENLKNDKTCNANKSGD